MVHKIKYRIISFVLAISLFLSGMYLDTNAGDAFFVYDSTGNTSLCARVFHADINHAKMCMTELLNECSDAEIQSYSPSPLLCPLYADDLFLLQGRSVRHPETVFSFYRTLDGIVTDYIHQSDGKKRI